MAVNQYLPFAVAGGANVYTPVNYAALSALGPGVSSGTADSKQANTTWRQASVAAAAIAQFVVDTSALNMNDDGSVSTFEANFITALDASINGILLSGLTPSRSNKNVLAIIAGVVTIDFNAGDFFVIPVTANITNFAFVNTPPDGKFQEITLKFLMNGTTYTIAYPTSFKWLGQGAAGTAPTFVFTNGYKNFVVLVGGDAVTTAYDASYSGSSAL